MAGPRGLRSERTIMAFSAKLASAAGAHTARGDCAVSRGFAFGANGALFLFLASAPTAKATTRSSHLRRINVSRRRGWCQIRSSALSTSS